jgi:hypothetical protein
VPKIISPALNGQLTKKTAKKKKKKKKKRRRRRKPPMSHLTANGPTHKISCIN